MRRALIAGAVPALAALGLAATVPAQAAGSQQATVYVFHGVPGLTVDVYANDDLLVEDFEPGDITDPVELPGGSYDLAVYPADADPASTEPAIEAEGVDVPGGANVTVAAHLNASGQPTLTPFVNDLSTIPAGQGRLSVRHTAAAPAVDILAGGQPALTGLTNPNEDSAELPAGTVEAAVALAGTTEPVIGPADVTVREGALTAVYAWGSAEDGNLALAVQTITGAHSNPTGVPSGEGGLAGDAMPIALVAAAGAAGALALGAAARARRARA